MKLMRILYEFHIGKWELKETNSGLAILPSLQSFSLAYYAAAAYLKTSCLILNHYWKAVILYVEFI